jgi:DNA polymerase-3 subunit epsilon
MGSEHVDFVVLDFETANPSLSSICQVGIAGFGDGTLRFALESLVDPEDYFDGMNVSIHGITEEMVIGSPKWPDVYPSVARFLCEQIAVSHTAFDRVAFQRACEKYGLQEVPCTWLDSARVVRRTWSCFSKSGYGLSNVAAHFGIEYCAHNAFEDARCAGEIMLRAITESKLDIRNWLTRVTLPIHASCKLSEYDPNVEGSLFGEIPVFTGSLSITRHEAAAMAARAGCQIDEGVTKRTTILVVGDQDIYKLAGHEKSSNHRKAENLIQKGQKIRILTQSDFSRLLLDHSAIKTREVFETSLPV